LFLKECPFIFGFMNYDFNIESEDEELWTEALESPEGDSLMKEAVLIQDPISSLGLESPLTAVAGTSIKNALKQLQKEKQNCLLIIENEILIGILTERDMLLKVTGKGFDLDLVTVEEFMTENPESLSPEDPIAYALNKMHIGGFRHVPIVNDDIEPVGVISISNIISTIADYFSREIINLPPLDRLVDSSNQEGG
jgi:CBS domain-containing protein